MTRLRMLAVTVALAAAVASTLPASASAIDAGGRLVVAIELHADRNDTVTACQDKPFGDGAEAFADTVAAALGLPLAGTSADPDDDCFGLNVSGPITTRGPGGERVWRFDAGALSSLAAQSGYAEAFLIVCTPDVTDRIEVRTGSQPIDASGCDANGYAWRLSEPLDVEIGYRATAGDLGAGLLAVASWWIALGTLMGLAVTGGARLALLRRMPLLGGAAAALIAGAAAYGWIFVASRSPLIDSMTMLAGLAGNGEVAILAGGSVLALALTALTTRRIVRGARRPRAVEANGPVLPGVPALPLRDVVGPYASQIRRAGPALLWAFVPAASFLFAYLIFLATPASVEIKVEGMLATAVAYALLVPAMSGATLPAVYDARRLAPGDEKPVLDALRAIGSSVREVWRAPVPPAGAPVGGAAVVLGRRAFVWEPLLAMPSAELAAGIALRGAKRRAWHGAIAAAALVVVMYGWVAGGDVPTLVVLAPMALLTAIGFIDVLERIRVRSAARNPARIDQRLRGVLAVGRAHARLASGAALGLVAAAMPGYAQAHWERTLRIAHRIGVSAGLSTVEIARIADEVVAIDAARGPAAPEPAAPEPPAPVPSQRAPRPAAAKKKAAPAKKKTAAKTTAKRAPAKKTATRRAPAKRGRQPRS